MKSIFSEMCFLNCPKLQNIKYSDETTEKGRNKLK